MTFESSFQNAVFGVEGPENTHKRKRRDGRAGHQRNQAHGVPAFQIEMANRTSPAGRIPVRYALRVTAFALSCSVAGACGKSSAQHASNAGSSSAIESSIGRAWNFPPGVTKPRIMIVGDSISAGPGCYKQYLLEDLIRNRYSKFEFVGEYSDDCGGSVRHSAVSCSTAEQYTHSSFSMPNCFQGKSFPGLSTLMTTHHPDLVMLQLGVNDVWGGKRAVNAILDSYATLVQQARAANPYVVLVVAQIQKIRPDCGTDDSVTRLAQALVNAVPAWAERQSTKSSPVFSADLWTNSDWTKAETLDCIHPNDIGAQRMGSNWFNALKRILRAD